MSRAWSRFLVTAGALLGIQAGVHADTITLEPLRDNTLIEYPNGENSNALGSLFCGRTGSMQGGPRTQRAVLQFGIANVLPPGTTIHSVALHMRLEQTVSGNQTHSLHRLLADWGEGTSSAPGGQGAPATLGDATWLHRFFDTSTWTTPGGDYSPAISATAIISSDTTVDVIWSSSGMAADVQFWLIDPCSDFGWLMRGNEVDMNTSKKLASREAIDPAVRPRLIIDYTPPSTDCPGDIVGKGDEVNIDDLLAVIASWGPCPDACVAPCSGDIAPTPLGDDEVNIDDLLLVIAGWGPCP